MTICSVGYNECCLISVCVLKLLKAFLIACISPYYLSQMIERDVLGNHTDLYSKKRPRFSANRKLWGNILLVSSNDLRVGLFIKIMKDCSLKSLTRFTTQDRNTFGKLSSFQLLFYYFLNTHLCKLICAQEKAEHDTKNVMHCMHSYIVILFSLNIQPWGAKETFSDVMTRERSRLPCGVSLSTYLNAEMQMRY